MNKIKTTRIAPKLVGSSRSTGNGEIAKSNRKIEAKTRIKSNVKPNNKLNSLFTL